MNMHANANTLNTRKFAYASLVLAALLAGALAACALMCVPAAWANQTLDAPTQVSDDITRVHVNKLDADTHEYVQGASMAIIEKDTGTVVDEWVTGKTTHENEKSLDVNKVYILREIAAPDGFEKVEDTEFIVNETEGEGITVLSGPGELTESYKVNLYDKAKDVTKETTVTRTRTRGIDSSTTVAPKTGDETPLSLIAILVAAGAVCIVLLQLPKRRLKD